MPHNKKTLAIPEKIRKEYHLTSLLSLHENAIVFSIEKKKPSSKKGTYIIHPNASKSVVKIMPKYYFDEDLFSTLQSLHHPLLLLPTELIAEEEYVYALYPRLLPFSEYLSREKLPLSKMVQWIKDMSQIISCLQDKNIIHGDIAPGNIYLDDEGHFYLGDFSSTKIASSHQSIASLIKKKNRTAATFPLSPSGKGNHQDIFSFLTILLKLLEASSPASINDIALLADLQNFVKNLLRELREKRSFPLTFREVCQKILSAIEEGKKEHGFSNQDFPLSPEKLDFLNDVTKPIKKKSMISPPVIALAFSCLIFLFAIIYYGKTGISGHQETVPPSEQFVQKETPTDNIKNSVQTATATPARNPTVSPTSAVNQQNDSILDISGKKYRDIPSSLKNDSAVKIIFSQGNQIKRLSSFSRYPSLEELYLDGNMISDLSNLSKFKRLTILGLSNNRVTDLSALKDIPSLKILDLSGQKNLSHISSLGSMKHLEYLILTETNATNNDVKYLQQLLPECMILQ